MQIQWFGQSAFRLAADSATVVRADLVLVTHEHADHNGVGAIEGDPGPRWVVPMHYRTHRVDWLDPPEPFLERMANVHRLDAPWFDTAELPAAAPLTIVPAAP